MPKVSVIIPTYNQSRYLCEAIDSVLAQSYKDFELIVVDDGSTDDTQEAVKHYGNKLQYVYQKNQGCPGAMNTGVRNSQGEYFAMLGHDDLWLPDFLATQVAVLDGNPELAFVSSGTHVIDDKGKNIGLWNVGHFRKKSFSNLLKSNFIFHLTTLVRRKHFDEVGQFDENLQTAQDYDLWLRLAKKFKFECTDIPLAKYRLHASNLSKNLDLNLQDHLSILKKAEIKKSVSFLKINECIARTYYMFGDRYNKMKLFDKASVCYFKAVLHWPIIGIYFWPLETEKLRFSFPYRLIKPYMFPVFVIFKKLLN